MNDQDEILRSYGKTTSEHVISEKRLAALIDDMPDIDDLGKIIIRLRWGLTTVKRMTFQEIADLFGIPEKRLKELSSVAYKHFAQGFMK